MIQEENLKKKKAQTQKTGKNKGVRILKIFHKDISFESSSSSEFFINSKPGNLDLQVNINSRNIKNNLFEVNLNLLLKFLQPEKKQDGDDSSQDFDAKTKHKTIYLVEITQTALLELTGNFEPEELKQIYLISTPDMLFPYARATISNLIAQAGYETILLDPINFAALYQANKQKLEQASTTPND